MVHLLRYWRRLKKSQTLSNIIYVVVAPWIREEVLLSSAQLHLPELLAILKKGEEPGADTYVLLAYCIGIRISSMEYRQ